MPAAQQMLAEHSLPQLSSKEIQHLSGSGSTPLWQHEFKAAIRDIDSLCRSLKLPVDDPRILPASKFPILVPKSFARRMSQGDINDPLLKQVLPVQQETEPQSGFIADPVHDLHARKEEGLLQKYHGRALLVLNGNCAVHCRYCFRREYPYESEPKSFAAWDPAISAIAEDITITEVILSGGDPLMMSDSRLGEFVEKIARIEHVRRLRVHTRLPIVLPSRVTAELLSLLQSTRLQPIVVVHANHPAELVDDCAEALQGFVRSGIPVLNQAVLLRGINDTFETLKELCECCVNLGVMPYYLHQLDRVIGAAHFEVEEHQGRSLIRQLREVLPGYAVPKYVREIPGEPSKTVLIE